jgi:hypothetical protein
VRRLVAAFATDASHAADGPPLARGESASKLAHSKRWRAAETLNDQPSSLNPNSIPAAPGCIHMGQSLSFSRRVFGDTNHPSSAFRTLRILSIEHRAFFILH